MINNDYYWLLRELAVSARCSVTELCNEAKVSHTTVWRWKGGKNRPNMGTWDRIKAAAETIKARSAA